MSVSKPHSMEDDIAYIRANLATKYLGHPDDDALYALDRLVEQYEAQKTKTFEVAMERRGAWDEIGVLKEQLEALQAANAAWGTAAGEASVRALAAEDQLHAANGLLAALMGDAEITETVYNDANPASAPAPTDPVDGTVGAEGSSFTVTNDSHGIVSSPASVPENEA